MSCVVSLLLIHESQVVDGEGSHLGLATDKSSRFPSVRLALRPTCAYSCQHHICEYFEGTGILLVSSDWLFRRALEEERYGIDGSSVREEKCHAFCGDAVTDTLSAMID